MPSSAFKTFETKLITEVDRLIDTHQYLSTQHYNGPGRRGLGHITRSGIVMLCAAWERYVELVIRETAGHMANRAQAPTELPKDVQKELAKYVKNHKHELKALDLAGDGWRTIYSVIAIEQTDGLNTPKSTILDPLCGRVLGVPNLSANWSSAPEDVDDFVKTRGGVAHTGSDATYVTIQKLKSSRQLIYQVVCDTDNWLTQFVKSQFPNHSVPWRRKTP